MREVVAARRRGSAQTGQRTRMQPQGIANVIETNAMSQLRVKQRNHVTPGTEGPGFLIRLGLASNLRDQEFRNEVANLPEQVQF